MPNIYYNAEDLPYKPRQIYDLTGKQFGRLTVLRVVGYYQPANNPRNRNLLWECQCTCGNLPHIITNNLKSKRKPTVSCGCWNTEKRYTHGLSDIPEYKVWCAMKARCLNPGHPHYFQYGARGITVCERWLKFEDFFADMGYRPSAKHSIERTDNNGNYEPSNCKWETQDVQMSNTRRNHILTINGVSRNIAQWAVLTGLKHTTIDSRLRHGWSNEDAILPLRPSRWHKGSGTSSSVD